VAEPPVSGVGRNAAEGFCHRQDRVNRQFMGREELQPQARTFAAGIDFIDRNQAEDNWFLQIETFDPHEPFFVDRKYRDLYPPSDAPTFDWPPYTWVKESPDLVQECRHRYAALLSMCDAKLGDILDRFDRHNMWEDTMLIVWTDHGFMLGEHDCWAKCWQPFYDEIAHTPFFVWDPRCGKAGERRNSLVQPSIDLAPTVLGFFGCEPPAATVGRDLQATFESDSAVREAAIFGLFGGHVNVTDGRYVYMRAPANPQNTPLYHYTHMPTNMRGHFGVDQLRDVTLEPPFTFTKGCPTMKIDASGESTHETLLFDTGSDPGQDEPLDDPAAAARLTNLMVAAMQACDAPREQFERLGLAVH
jgi:arylsulfatase A-like enzyme